ncbi:hypothetical protein [Streptomyces sp. PAN_FS17]|uniref:hypothetical protein n=1 Tax=Streptomyces sp. PAN_FS17 TaxID=1855351 RepID=UPI00089A0BAA|nr:hypothetical protein [Streptomyces sp. PAN_FS17]SED25086.1 hypothetical protein SAMN05216482_6640 [Streptomyces sp. PAN_FS17]
MLALRLTRGAHPAVQLRRLLVAAASAGTGFLLLSALGYAMSHPDSPAAATLRLAWCAPPLAATIHLAVAVARTDPGTRPRPGLAAAGLGPGRLMLVSAITTALSCLLGSMLALLVFLHLRGDLTGMPFDGDASQFLAADSPLPLPAALTLLALTPALASAAVALLLRPKPAAPTATKGRARPYGRFGVSARSADRETFGAYGRFGARLRGTVRGGATTPDPASGASQNGGAATPDPASAASQNGGATTPDPASAAPQNGGATTPDPASAASQNGGAPQAPASAPAPAPAEEDGSRQTPDDLTHFPVPRKPPAGLPWGITILTAGLAVETYAGRVTADDTLALPTALPTGPTAVLVGWVLAAVGLALAAPGLAHLCGRVLQAVRPGPLRLLAGRGLMAEATRIGRPLGVVCAVAAAVYAMAPRSGSAATAAIGPLSALGATVVAGATVTTLFMAALEARQARADTTAALLRLGAPTAMLRSAAALRAGVLLAVFGPLTLIVAELAALPLAAR